jgi:O-antigen/teichoic acid export membrane protein
MAALALTGAVRALARIGAGRWFGNEALGAVTLAFSVAAIATIVGAGGLSPGITKFVSQLRGEDHPELAQSLGIYASRLSIAFSVVGAIIGVAYVWLSDGGATWTERVAVGTLVFAFGLYQGGKSILYGEDHIRAYALRELAGGLLFAMGMAVALLVGSPSWIIVALALGYVPVASTSLRAFRAMGRHRGLPTRLLAGYGVLGAVGSLAGVGFSYSTPIAANFIDALTGAALLGGVLTILEPFNLLPRAVSLVLLPDLSEKNAREGVVRSGVSLRTATGLVAAASAPVLLLIILERDRVLGLIFPDLVGGPTLAWFAVAFFIRVIGAPAVTSLAALDFKRASIAMWSSLVGFSLAIGIWIVAGRTIGITAIGVGYAIGTVIQVVAPLVVATRRYKVRWGTFWIRTGLALLCAAVASRFEPTLILDGTFLVVVIALSWHELGDLFRAIRRRQVVA